MSSIWGNNIKLSIFGESHGNAIGINIDGLPSGFELDIEEEMK
jgi:chorismate synthase